MSQSKRKRSATDVDDRELRKNLLKTFDTDSSSSDDMDPKAKKVKADDFEDTDDVKGDDEESYHEKLLVRELKGLVIEKRNLCVQEEDLDEEMERKLKEYQAARDDLKRKKQDIDNQIAMKRSRIKPRKSQPDTDKTAASGESSPSSEDTSSATTDDLTGDQQDRNEGATASEN